MKIQPLGSRVLLREMFQEEQSAGGIYIPPSAQEKTQEGTVVAVGSSDEITVKVNDKVIYDKYAGTQIKVDDKEHLIVKMDDVIAIVS